MGSLGYLPKLANQKPVGKEGDLARKRQRERGDHFEIEGYIPGEHHAWICTPRGVDEATDSLAWLLKKFPGVTKVTMYRFSSPYESVADIENAIGIGGAMPPAKH
ncbi:MAG: hypothetical protein WAK55_12905 [Xanthobacteraceae bacterium]